MKQIVICAFLILTGSRAAANPGESADYPLDWRYAQYEPGAAMCLWTCL